MEPRVLSNPFLQNQIIGQQMINLNRVQNKPQPNHCGYCESDGSYSWGFTKQVMHPYTYQLLAERGWRRCGSYYYKPDIQKSCCKLWTHRLDVNDYKIKKDQKKTIRQFSQWLLEKTTKNKKTNQQKKVQSKKTQKNTNKKPQQQKKQKESQKMMDQVPLKWKEIVIQSQNCLVKAIEERKQQFFNILSKNFTSPENINFFIYKIDKDKLKCFVSLPSADSDFYSNLLMILYGSNKKLFKKQFTNIQFIKQTQKFIIQNLNLQFKNNLIIEVQRSGYILFTQKQSPKLERRLKNQKITQINKQKHEKKIQTKNQVEVQQKNKNKKKNLKEQEKQMVQQTHEHNMFKLQISSQIITFGPLIINIVPAELTNDSWKMYQRYSTQIHEKEQKSKSSYSGFLCQKALTFTHENNSNLCPQLFIPAWELDLPENQRHPTQVKGQRKKFMGCYHMKYYIEQEFIGVGVVDFFPQGLSSVYFFYEPKYKDHRLGVFSSLIQIQYVRWLSLSFPEYKYYYMGFYIQNCQKMLYKGNYQPFSLLCPVTYQFVPCTNELRTLIQKIEKKEINSVQLSKDNTKIDDMNFSSDIGVFINNKVKIKYQGMMLTLRELNPRILVPVLGMLRDMAQVWGKHLFQAFTFTF